MRERVVIKYAHGMHPNSRAGSFKKGHKINVGKILSIETRKKISDALKGRKKPDYFRIKMKSKKNGLGSKRSIEFRKMMSIKQRGPRGSNWKCGITSSRDKIRRGIKYQIWRKSVFERDKYACQDCCQSGGTLNAHHIKPFALFPNLRYKISNGRTLCEKCHKKIHKIIKNLCEQELL